MSTILWLLAALTLGAPRLPYGDVAVAEHADPSLDVDPSRAESLADLTVARAAFEGLYTLGPDGEVLPELAAELPRFEGTRAIIPLRRGVVRHDGKPLEGGVVAQAIARWSATGSLARHLALPMAGARSPGGAPPIAAVALDDGTPALVVELAQPFPELARLWAAARGGLVFAPTTAKLPAVGSGPFRIEGQRGDGVTLSAFTGHRDGRPYLDRLVFRAGSAARPTPATGATLALDVYAGPTTGPAPARELWFLRVGSGKPELRSALLFRAIEAALGRDRLAKRYLSGEASPTATIRGEDDDPQLTLPSPRSGGLRVTLAIPARLAPDRRFAERVQLDLLRAGVTATIETVDDAALTRARAAGEGELSLDCFVFEGGAARDPTQALFALMALASASGAEHVISERELSAFAAEDLPARARRVSALDRRLRDEAWIVPIAQRLPRARIGSGLIDASTSATGAVRLEEAWSSRLLPRSAADEATPTRESPSPARED